MPTTLKQLAVNTPTLKILVLAWLFLGLFQTLHFHFYYDQSWLQSLIWSYRDWLLWVLLSLASYSLLSERLENFKNKFTKTTLLVISALLTGMLQVLMIIITDYLIAGLSRQFWQDFFYLYQKRWFQNLLTFAALWALIQWINNSYLKPPTANNPTHPGTSNKKIKIVDGKQHFWIRTTEIFRIEVTGNYICFVTVEGQRITRGTMKAIHDELVDCGFLRVNRSNLINTSHIKAVKKTKTGFEVSLTNDDTCKISRRQWKQFKDFTATIT